MPLNRQVYHQIQTSIEDYIKQMASEDPVKQRDLRSLSITAMQKVVQKVEIVFEENERMTSFVDSLGNTLASHINFIKKTSVKVDSLVNNIKNSNNSIFESLGQFKAKPATQLAAAKYPLFTQKPAARH